MPCYVVDAGQDPKLDNKLHKQKDKPNITCPRFVQISNVFWEDPTPSADGEKPLGPHPLPHLTPVAVPLPKHFSESVPES